MGQGGESKAQLEPEHMAPAHWLRANKQTEKDPSRNRPLTWLSRNLLIRWMDFSFIGSCILEWSRVQQQYYSNLVQISRLVSLKRVMSLNTWTSPKVQVKSTLSSECIFHGLWALGSSPRLLKTKNWRQLNLQKEFLPSLLPPYSSISNYPFVVHPQSFLHTRATHSKEGNGWLWKRALPSALIKSNGEAEDVETSSLEDLETNTLSLFIYALENSNFVARARNGEVSETLPGVQNLRKYLKAQ